MLPAVRQVFLLIGTIALSGCSLDESGLLVGDASGDAPFDAPSDAPEEPFVCTDGGPPSCEDAAPYRQPLLYSADAGAPCPPGYETRDLSHEIPATPTCTCECTDAGPPSCATTTISYAYGTFGFCNVGTGTVALSGACTATNQTTFLNEALQIAPPAVVGGCGGGTSIPPNATTTNVRLCLPQCASDEGVCSSHDGLQACVYVVGDVQSCPSNYPSGPFYVGDAPQVTCDACSCVASGDCSGSTVHLYAGNNACGSGDQSFAMDGQCHGLGGGQIAAFQSAKIVPSLTGNACKVSPGAAHTTYGGESFTVCCK